MGFQSPDALRCTALLLTATLLTGCSTNMTNITWSLLLHNPCAYRPRYLHISSCKRRLSLSMIHNCDFKTSNRI